MSRFFAFLPILWYNSYMKKQEFLFENEIKKEKYECKNCTIKKINDVIVVSYRGIALYAIDEDDEIGKRYVSIMLYDDGLAYMVELSEIFDISISAQKRCRSRYKEKGFKGLGRKKRKSYPLKVDRGMQRAIRRLFKAGLNNVRIAHELGITEGSVRNVLKKLGLSREASMNNADLPFLYEKENAENEESKDEAVEENSDIKESVVNEEDIDIADKKTGYADVARAEAEENVAGNNVWSDGRDRRLDRILAARGLIDDAAPIFVSENSVPNLGIMLSVPFIVKSGIIEVFKKIYGSIGPAFYGLRTIVMVLLFMALLRIKNAEQMKERDTKALGLALGLDRFPETKSIRRKLLKLSEPGNGIKVMRALAKLRLRKKPDLIGFLYIDGYVREYHGKNSVAKGFKPQRRLAVPATTDNWVNDKNGDPIFMVTSEVNQGLVSMLPKIVKEILETFNPKSKLTIIFDRGGWSPRLFAELSKCCYILTYRKGKTEKFPGDYFIEEKEEIAGKLVTYKLHENEVWFDYKKPDKTKGSILMRQVTRLKDEKQTQVLTTRTDLSNVEVLYWMFNRWRQENFFKYMKEHFAIDKLSEYGTEELSDELTRPNPERKKLEKSMKPLRNKISKNESKLLQLTEKIKDLEKEQPENQKAHKKKIERLGTRLKNTQNLLQEQRDYLSELKAKRNEFPERVKCNDKLKKLKMERKRIADCIKMTAYNIETEMYGLLRSYDKYYEKDGRKLIVAALNSTGDIEVVGNELRVTLANLSTPHWTKAVAGIINELNETQCIFPGTNMKLKFFIKKHE
jgi:hypothetical protein